ncbi:MAG TPA: hypothetical protein DCM28_20900 [Phycisphaerales bacterium]|nr:hypothetical protein [Phycisphaerales bacterium]HCD31083.1 hypothetical protein [Phycisphaerales bacterium]|tara:strand:+ start:451 stop:696 length:246 start_codon:yes stop_codon:yes gene_type:complete
MTDTNKPVGEIRIGWLKATIWANAKSGQPRYSVCIMRMYKDKNGNWQDTSSFGSDDLMNVAKLADLAQDRILKLREEGSAS